MAEAALAGVRVLELGVGVAGSYCGKLFADMGAHVARPPHPGCDALATQRLDLNEPGTEGLYNSYLNAGKAQALATGDYDILIQAEGAGAAPAPPRIATLDISWFGQDGPYANWQGSDLLVQALTGMAHVAGPKEGPPLFTGEHQAALVGGAAAYAAGMVALIGGAASQPQTFDISILESVMIMSEMQMCNAIAFGKPLVRMGTNRFEPTCPLSIHECKAGWIGITPLTPHQWQAFCDILELPHMRDDPDLLPSRTRYPFADQIEPALDKVFPEKTAEEWAELGRLAKVPMVVVPNAQGILEHPIFNARGSLVETEAGGYRFKTPRTPFSLEDTPPRIDVNKPTKPKSPLDPLSSATDAEAPLAGVRVIDFSMGWAGPLATRILADLGAEIIKIEAGRYPDWWRGVDWSTEAIAHGQYEESRHFSVINRGKKSVSLDLTEAEGLRLAKALVSRANVVVENQAAGVMDRLGLSYKTLSAGRHDLIMLSMSAFGAGNAWSDTRAYGSVLEQGSGLPSFCGSADGPPTMGHVAYGDPIGGLYGGAALLTAIYRQRRTGRGQWINNSQIEAMLPFTAGSILIQQATGREPIRRGNRHSALAPHGIYKTAGDDAWIAIAATDAAWPALAQKLGRPGWSTMDLTDRCARADQIDATISAWAAGKDASEAAAVLQAARVAAAPLLPIHQVEADPQMNARDFFYETERPYIGRLKQAGLPFRRNGARYPMRTLAPFLGADSADALRDIANVSDTAFRDLIKSGIVSLKPTQLRSA